MDVVSLGPTAVNSNNHWLRLINKVCFLLVTFAMKTKTSVRDVLGHFR